MRRCAVSSWSVDGLLQTGVPLLDLPAHLRHHGFSAVELCHFHLPTTDAAYLQALRDQLAAARVELYSVLLDAGDIVSPDPAQRAADMAFTQQWIGIAAALGAHRVRIAAGQQPPTPEVIQRSAAQLHSLAQDAAASGVAVSTENWRTTAQEPEALLAILAACPSPIGVCVDTGNAEATRDKYQTLRQLVPHATSVHFKARSTSAGRIDHDDVQQCLALLDAVAFDGVITLIYEQKHHEWDGLRQLRNALSPYV